MMPTEQKELVSIHPKHLRLMQVHLDRYFILLCERAEPRATMKEINDLGLMDFVIDTILGSHCNDTA